MLFAIAIRNVIRNHRRFLPIIIIVAVVFAITVFGNSILAFTNNSLYRTYVGFVAGDLSISATSETNFTIFGSDLLLIGEYLNAEVIPNYHMLIAEIESYPEVRAATGIVTTTALVDLGPHRTTRTVFGISGDEYRNAFPDLSILAGNLPVAGSPGIVVQHDGSTPESRIGDNVTLTTRTGRTFTIRVLPVVGVFDYPVDDPFLDSVVLVDANSARALAGFSYGRTAPLDSRLDRSVFQSDFDELFSSTEADIVEMENGGEAHTQKIDVDLFLKSDMPESEEETVSSVPGAIEEPTPESTSGVWNFLLVALSRSADRRIVMNRIETSGFTEDSGFRVREWYQTVGGSALIVRNMRRFFYVGLVFVTIGAAIVITNALMLSVLERTKEIGTMRALGGENLHIGSIIITETVIIVLGAGVVGMIIGGVFIHVLNQATFIVDNQYLEILFGGEPIKGRLSISFLLHHLIGAIFLSIICVIYPLLHIIRISPAEAMTA